MKNSKKRPRKRTAQRRCAVVAGSAISPEVIRILKAIDRECLQIRKGGYRWRDSWEVSVPAPCGHYREEEERTIAYGATAAEAIIKALTTLGYLPN